MAKKKDDRESRIKNICDIINKGTFGGEKHDAVSFLGSSDIIQMERFPSGCPALDDALGGGWAKGRFIELFGAESGGKCLVADTYIYSKYGMETIKEAFKRLNLKTTVKDKVEKHSYPLLSEDGNIEETTHFTWNGKKEVFKIITESGLEIEATGNHPLRVFDKNIIIWKNVSDIKVRDKMVVMKGAHVNPENTTDIDKDDVGLLAMIIAAGAITDNDILFVSDKEDLLKRFEDILNVKFKFNSIRKLENKKDDGTVWKYICESESLVKKFRRRYGRCCEEGLDLIKIPYTVRTSSLENQKEFLRVYSECWGDFNKRKKQIKIKFVSKQLARQFQLLLLNLGVLGKLSGNDGVWELLFEKGNEYLLSQVIFAKPFGKKSKRKEFSSFYDSDKVISINSMGKKPTFDVVKPDHTFWTNGLISHNTTLALQAIAEHQKKYPEEDVAFIDSEFAFDENYAKALGVDLRYMIVHQPDSGEQALNVLSQLVQNGVKLVVVDSVAALTTRAELEGDIGDVRVGEQARLMSQALRRLVQETGTRGATVFWTNQMRDKIGVMYGDKTTTPAGHALKHYASIRVKIDRIGTVRETINGEKVAICNKTKADVKKNKTAPPFRVAEFYITYGYGVDKAAAILDAALAYKIIVKKGSWFSFEGEQIGQGRMAILDMIRENKELAERMQKAIDNAKVSGVKPEEDNDDPTPIKRSKSVNEEKEETDPDAIDSPAGEVEDV